MKEKINMEENLKILNETLVDTIIDKFEKINIEDIYTDEFQVQLKTLADNHHIYIDFNTDPPYTSKVNGDAKEILNKETGYDYQIIFRLPNRKLTEQDNRDLTITFLHEFTHAVIFGIIKKLMPEVQRDKILLNFDSTRSKPFRFDINKVTQADCERFLNYVFSLKERPVFALSIAYSCYHHRQTETLKTLFDTNKKIILDYGHGVISEDERFRYISRLKDEKVFLFEIQYAVYFLSDRKWIFKLDSFMNLIKKYENRFSKILLKRGG